MGNIKKDRKRLKPPGRAPQSDNTELKAELLALRDGESLTVDVIDENDAQRVRMVVYRAQNDSKKEFSTSIVENGRKVRVWRE